MFDTLPPLDAPLTTDGPSGPPPPHVQMLRAVRELTLLEGRLDDYLSNGFFPTLTVGFTPGATCCGPGGVTLCANNPGAWQGTPWEQLDFSITGSHAHVYMLQSTGTELTATARADLDCDGTFADVVLHCTRDAAGTHCDMVWPDVLE